MIVGEESPEHIADIIYSALDHNGNGCVPVSKVLEYIQNEIPNSDISNSLPLCDLEHMLTAQKRKYIDRLELTSVMKLWTEKIEQDAKSELQNLETLDESSPSSLLIEELPLCESGPLNMSTHSSDSPERITKREYNDMVDKLASLSQIKRGLEEENYSLQALLKEHEENYNAVLAENEHLKKTVTVHEKKLEGFQTLQQEYVETNCAFQVAESHNRDLKLKLQQSEKICANLQQKLDETVEQKCETAASLEKVGSSLSECRKELSAQKEAYERLRLKNEADKQVLCERIVALEDMITGLESKNKILNEIKSELELKVASILEESANVSNSWRSFLSDSSSGSSICLQSQGGLCHQFCCTESVENYRKTLYAELQASGDLCLTHKQLEEQLREWQEKAIKYKQELDEYKENEKVAKEIVKSAVEHLELSEHCGDMYESKSQFDVVAEVENITDVKAKQSLSYLISFVTAISEKEHSFRKISKQCLVHPREAFTQSDPIVTRLSIMDQTARIAGTERSTQVDADFVSTKVSTIDRILQISASEKYTQTDPVATELSMGDQTAQIYCSENCTHTKANLKMLKVMTMDQTTQTSSCEIIAQEHSGATCPYYAEDGYARGDISIDSHTETVSTNPLQMAGNVSPKTEPLTQTLQTDEETRCGAQELQPSTEQTCLQYSGNEMLVDKTPESCGAQESKSSLEQTLLFQTCLQPAGDKTPESTFHSELLQHMKKFLRKAVSCKNLRRICTLAVSLLLIFLIGSSFLNLFVNCCLYSHTFYGTLCSVMEDVFKPYVTLRHLSPPPT
ncbi:uncharacterized protein LOC126162581 [Schistocerca cancellata]|uniref:uncharacterized protein LOC126162581 n=1 Tax=Schistocerca cancellata TaxID=274614 RepID=UPI0021193C79|nr:uncharacterized protein LOC126162581 [Schistocerca cancellata]